MEGRRRAERVVSMHALQTRGVGVAPAARGRAGRHGPRGPEFVPRALVVACPRRAEAGRRAGRRGALHAWRKDACVRGAGLRHRALVTAAQQVAGAEDVAHAPRVVDVHVHVVAGRIDAVSVSVGTTRVLALLDKQRHRQPRVCLKVQDVGVPADPVGVALHPPQPELAAPIGCLLDIDIKVGGLEVVPVRTAAEVLGVVEKVRQDEALDLRDKLRIVFARERPPAARADAIDLVVDDTAGRQGLRITGVARRRVNRAPDREKRFVAREPENRGKQPGNLRRRQVGRAAAPDHARLGVRLLA